MRRINPTTFRIARRGTSREINRQIAVNLIRARQPISRAELARLMGIRRGAVSLLVSDLLRSGLVFEGAKGESRRGRRPMQLHIETRRRCTVAVDVSASHTLIQVTDPMGQPLLGVHELPTRAQPEGLVRELAHNISNLLAAHPELGECLGVGVVISGLVEPDGGRLLYSPTLGWREVDLLEPLRAATGLPVVVENSMKACVLAQVWAVRGDAPVDGPVAFMNLSDGVGVGIAIDGKLLRGANNTAGEFGHVALDMNGPLCSCGQRGCLEAYVSKRATLARYLGADPSWPESARLNGVSVGKIVECARGGEARAIDTLKTTGDYLGRGIATIVKAIDPRRIYVGGEIVSGWELLWPSVRGALREQALVPLAGEPDIRPVPPAEHPRLRGAAALINTPRFAAPTFA
jgi:N-acetylglucosamine repressor